VSAHPPAASVTPLTPQDAEHLHILSIAHYVMAGVMALVACFPILHLVIGIGILASAARENVDPAAGVGIVFVAIAMMFILAGWTLAACIAYAGRNLARRERHMFCLVVAGIEACTCVPLGTVLGVLTIVVLIRSTVKAAFGVAPASPT
jgi:hypothetical protein